MKILIKKAKIVDKNSTYHLLTKDILVENGTIASIEDDLEVESDTVFEAPGLLVSTGWVDVFADYAEPGFEQKETIATGLDAAANGGFTDVFIVPNTQPVIHNKALVDNIQHWSRGHGVHLHPIGAVTKQTAGKELAEMYEMHDAGAIAFSDGWVPVQNNNVLMKALEYLKAFSGTLIQVPIDAQLADGGLMHEGVVSQRLGLPGLPAVSETVLLQRDIELLRYTGGRLHITGISCAHSVAIIRKAKAEGLHVSCSVTPYHLLLTDEKMSRYESVYKVFPPLRTETDRLALLAAVKDGTVDCIATHHRPHETDAKHKELEYAAAGMAVQETAFPIIWEALHDSVGLERLTECLTSTPRKLFGLQEQRIAEGANACLTLFSDAINTCLTTQEKKSKSINNPLLNTVLQGAVLGIINNGTFVATAR
jgi:dihydroorotase